MKKTPWWSWRVTPEELQEQVDKYHELGLWKSYRGQVVFFFTVVFLMSIGVSFFMPSVISTQDVLLGFIVYAVLVALGYFGYKWAFIGLLAYWTLDKVTTIFLTLGSAPGSFVSQLIFLVAGIVLTVRAIKVESERKKLNTSRQGSNATTPVQP